MIAQTIVATLKAVGIAVSYTHLDVYKRQEHDRTDHRRHAESGGDRCLLYTSRCV
ncbi:hypothetical protein [Erwinia amylovora]